MDVCLVETATHDSLWSIEAGGAMVRRQVEVPSNQPELDLWGLPVSMKSGLRDRNNVDGHAEVAELCQLVSMKSGLGDRNNGSPRKAVLTRDFTNVCERSAPQAPAPPLC